MNSIIIAINIMKRQIKEINTIVFLFLFPIMATLLAVVTVSTPTTYNLGIDKKLDDFKLYQYLENYAVYNVIPLNQDDIQNTVIGGDIDMGIVFHSEGEYPIEVISEKANEKVDTLAVLLNEMYSTIRNNSAIPYKDNTEDNEGMFSSKFDLSIGMFLIFMIMYVGTSMTILLDDKKEKTFMRLFSMPISRETVVLGYMIAIFTMGMLQIIWFILFNLLLGIEISIPIISVIIILAMFLITCTGLSVGMMGLVQEKDKYTILLPIIAVFSNFLSGSIIPIEFLGEKIKYLSYFIPQRWVNVSLLKLNQGQFLVDILPNLGVLLLFALVFFSFGTKILDKEA